MGILDCTWSELLDLLNGKNRIRIMLKAEGSPLTHCAVVTLHPDNAPSYVAHGFFMAHDGSSITLGTPKENIIALNYVNTIPTDLMYALGVVTRRLSMFKAGEIKFSTLLLSSGGINCTYSVDKLE